MFESIESPVSIPAPPTLLGKENTNRQFYSTGNIQNPVVPPSNNNNNLKDPKRKSIFDPNTEKTTQDNIMINNNKPLSLPTIPPPPLNNNFMGPSVQNQLNQQQINQTNQIQK